MSNDEVHERIQDTRGVHDDLLTLVKSGKSGDIILWDGEDNSAGDSEGIRTIGRQKKRWEDIKEWIGLGVRESLVVPSGYRAKVR